MLVSLRRRPAATSFVQDLFGLVVQAPCPVDYQDSSAEGGAPSGGSALAVANGPSTAAHSEETKAQGRSEAAEDGQSSRRHPTAPQGLSARPNGQVSGFINPHETAAAQSLEGCVGRDATAS